MLVPDIRVDKSQLDVNGDRGPRSNVGFPVPAGP
jgi:hypothetical protein